jgi:hypothetical protein
VRLDGPLSSKDASMGQLVAATVAAPVYALGAELIAPGAPAKIRVRGIRKAGHLKGSSQLELSLSQVSINGRLCPVVSRIQSFEGKARGKDTAKKTGMGAGLGAMIGGMFHKGKGAVQGAAAGAGAAIGYQEFTQPEAVNLPAETLITFRLENGSRSEEPK